MSIANKDNVTKYSDVSRTLTRTEADQNFQELKNVIDDVDQLELDLGDKVSAVQLESVRLTLQNQLDVLGINVPAAPASGTYHLVSVNGVLSWELV